MAPPLPGRVFGATASTAFVEAEINGATAPPAATAPTADRNFRRSTMIGPPGTSP